MRQIVVGSARVAVINIGDLKFMLKDVIAVPESNWRQRYGALFEQKLSFPSQSVCVSIGGNSILIDAGEYSKFAAEGSEYTEKDYAPPPDLVTQLEASGVHAEEVDHVIITHAHYDHFAGVTTLKGEELVPTFPRARYYLGRGDWEWSELKSAMANQDSNEANTLGRIHKLGSLELVSEERDLVPGVRIIPAPGESPGHQIVKIQSEGKIAYCVGDLFHSRVEVENPGWMASWCDPVLNLRSRERLLESALPEHAVVIPAHMPPGWIVRLDKGLSYDELPL
jgi:glyoxylase-like metal-dependent hydrolase (beta-lactamase superfamily II)